MIALGLDGFRNGWVAVRIDGARRTIHFIEHVREIVALGFDRAGVDIPIGMTENGVRDCDLMAREKLRPHSSRVFTGARRWLWQEFTDPDDANVEAQRRGQSRVSRQLWHLGPKIMEVDAFVQTNPSLEVREVHPELVFLRLNDGKPLDSKKSERGAELRRVLLKRDGFAMIDTWLNETRIGQGARADDVLDACACAIAARDFSARLPEGDAPRDSSGLPMQIWF